MEIVISNKLKSDLAVYHEEGLIIFEELLAAINKGEKVVLSFVGLTRCSTQFLNASIGKLYLMHDPNRIDVLLGYDYGEYSLMKDKVQDVRNNAINSKEYDELIENA